MVYLKIAGGEIEPVIETTLAETVLDVKARIQQEVGVEVCRQSLWHHNRILRDHDYIDDCGFRNRETLYLTVIPLPLNHKVHVRIKAIGGDGYVRIRETDKVSDLRNKLERHWAVPSSLITLRRSNVVMENTLPLYAYYVNEDVEIDLSIN
ncbi:hypothetical protein CR513_61169, partial [Mucuna pruriens]